MPCERGRSCSAGPDRANGGCSARRDIASVTSLVRPRPGAARAASPSPSGTAYGGHACRSCRRSRDGPAEHPEPESTGLHRTSRPGGASAPSERFPSPEGAGRRNRRASPRDVSEVAGRARQGTPRPSAGYVRCGASSARLAVPPPRGRLGASFVRARRRRTAPVNQGRDRPADATRLCPTSR
ncbi:MAG: hypothetical protein QOH74_1069 [Gaiellales bacterium]|nr:hypothetical protein [Gaiellales bacterium]